MPHFFRNAATLVSLLSVFGRNEMAKITAAQRAALAAISDLIAPS